MIQNGIILDGVVYELTENYPDNTCFVCRNCELYGKCGKLEDFALCNIFGADDSREVFRKVKMERKL